jgi:maltooligosyltrehalose trehalohydrolase
MNRVHRMPFGAESAGGQARFRIWAPSAAQVDVALPSGGAVSYVPMQPRGEGWFESLSPAAPGTPYRFRIDGGLEVPDPASRYNPDDVQGASVVVDPADFEWTDGGWRGRPWEEAVLYELHVGTFTPEGTYAAATGRLDYLASLGVTAIELMPLADFPGRRGWGYDGVLPFAPEAAYGRPRDLKRFVNEAHARGLMVFLDVVYNHFGPEGNYLHAYARPFFTERQHTPWGAAINFDGLQSRPVRDFFIHNALYWLEEYHMDGLRLDAVHAIMDEGSPHILVELAERVRAGPGRARHVHLVLENDNNESRYLSAGGGPPRGFNAQWNDDVHHAFHVLLTGETDGYYTDYADEPARHLGRALAEGYAYQGERSRHRGGAARGEPSGALPPAAVVSFLQNHDQVGNRAFGERLAALADERALRAAVCAWLLAPAPPLLFMGEEFGAATPFLYFCDFGPGLGDAVTRGRRREFAAFARFASAEAQAAIPDPNAPETFARSRLDWDCLSAPPHSRWLACYRRLLALRREHIVPLLAGAGGRAGRYAVRGPAGVVVEWRLARGSRLEIRLNLSAQECSAAPPSAPLLHCEPGSAAEAFAAGRLPAHAAACYLAAGDRPEAVRP